MFSGIVKKLRSTRGASLSMALMLMLVCLTVAGITLTASTAVAGRQRSLKDNDKSYYNVTSAAGLYWDALKANPTVTIERKQLPAGEWTAVLHRSDVDIDIVSAPLPSDASFFEIASFDLLFSNFVTTDNLTDSRQATSGAVASNIDLSDPSNPNPIAVIEVNTKSYYNSDSETPSFTITPSGNPDNASHLRHYFEVVNVRVRRNSDLTYQLEFSEVSNPKIACTITARASVIDVYSGGVWTGMSEVKWTCVSIGMGGL